MLQCNIFPGLPPDFLDAEVNLFLVPFMDSEAESENPPRAGAVTLGDIGALGKPPALGLGELTLRPATGLGPVSGHVSVLRRLGKSWSRAEL